MYVINEEMDLSRVTYNYSFIFEFEKNWNEPEFVDFLRRRWMDPLLYSSVYIVLVFSIKSYMKNNAPFDLRLPLAIWSGGLAVFSIFGALRTLPEFVFALTDHNFQYSVCIPSWFTGVPGFWGSVFTISKVIELGDTLFIVLRKKPLVFLHWYHHVTVLCYSWYSFSEETAAGRWFMVMNYVIHSFMYSYYALRAMQIYVPQQVNLAITTMQLCQMIMGCYINIMVFVYKSRGEFCQQTNLNLVLSSLMYTTYFILFANFFYRSYIVRKPKTKKS